jgi:hypothetical protein
MGLPSPKATSLRVTDLNEIWDEQVIDEETVRKALREAKKFVVSLL